MRFRRWRFYADWITWKKSWNMTTLLGITWSRRCKRYRWKQKSSECVGLIDIYSTYSTFCSNLLPICFIISEDSAMKALACCSSTSSKRTWMWQRICVNAISLIGWRTSPKAIRKISPNRLKSFSIGPNILQKIYHLPNFLIFYRNHNYIDNVQWIWIIHIHIRNILKYYIRLEWILSFHFSRLLFFLNDD